MKKARPTPTLRIPLMIVRRTNRLRKRPLKVHGCYAPDVGRLRAMCGAKITDHSVVWAARHAPELVTCRVCRRVLERLESQPRRARRTRAKRTKPPVWDAR